MPNMDCGTFWTIVGNLISLIGLIAAVVFFILGKKKILLQYATSTTPLVTEKMAAILNDRISIDGQPIKNLDSTTIRFVNSGNQPITSTDFAEQDRLRIVLSGELYGFDVSKGNQKLTPTLAPIDSKTINIVFENLKPKQYFAVTLLHDGSLNVYGELKTGDIRVYRSSHILMYLLAGFFVTFLVISFDHFTNGPINLAWPSASSFLLVVIGCATIYIDLLCFMRLIKERKWLSDYL